jgi:acyl-CoA thioester hydrolase
MLQPFTVTFALAGVSEDVSRFKLRNEFRREDGELAARITSLGGWLDLRARKLVAPPEALAAAILALDRTDDFTPLESSVKATA